MSKFPTKDNFKNHKSKPQEYLESVLPFKSYLFSKNILPRKTKKIYIYDVFGQKFADFFLDHGRYYLGFSDKYITRMVKDYLKSTILSYSNGIFTYRFLKVVRDTINFDFKLTFFARNYEMLKFILDEFSGNKTTTNSNYLNKVLGLKVVFKEPLVFDPFSDALEVRELVNSAPIIFLGRGIRYPEIMEWLSDVDSSIVVLNFGRFFGVFARDRKSKSFIEVIRSILRGSRVDGMSDVYSLSEFDAVFGYYYTIREAFLVKKKLFRLKNYTSRWLTKFVDDGFFDVLTPYSARVREDVYSEEMNKFLLSEGILTDGNILFFSFQTEEPDFTRLRRKINQYRGQME